MSWFKTGMNSATPKDQQSSNGKGSDRVFRFFMKTGEEKEVTFLDGKAIMVTVDGERHTLPAPFIMDEYNLELNGKFYNYFTAPDGDRDPLAEAGATPYEAAFFTVIDHTEFHARNGKVYKDQKKLFVIKTASDAWQRLKKLVAKANKKNEKRGRSDHGLRGWRVEIERVGRLSSNSGSEFTLIEHADPGATDDKQPHDYGKVLAPKSERELDAVASRYSGVEPQRETSARQPQAKRANPETLDSKSWDDIPF